MNKTILCISLISEFFFKLFNFYFSDREIAETFYNFAAVSNRGARFVLDTSTIKATFISPGIEVSEANLYFRIDVTPVTRNVVPKISKLFLNFIFTLTITDRY